MSKQTETKFEQILENPITLKLFIFLKSKNPESVGIREVMRATKMKSSSTVSRHLEAMDEIGLVQKLPSNRYILTSKGLSLRSFQVPVKLTANLIKGNFVTISTYQISFLIMMSLSTFILIWYDIFLAAINGLVGLIIGLLISLKHWFTIKKQMKAYRDINNGH